MNKVRISEGWHEEVYHNLTGIYDHLRGRVILDKPNIEMVNEYNDQNDTAYIYDPAIDEWAIDKLLKVMETE